MSTTGSTTTSGSTLQSSMESLNKYRVKNANGTLGGISIAKMFEDGHIGKRGTVSGSGERIALNVR